MQTSKRSPAFYKEQALIFKEYADKHPEEDRVSLMWRWASSQNFTGIERERIWKIARKLWPHPPRIIKEGSEEWIRLQAVLDMLYEIDLAYLYKLIDQEKAKGTWK